MEGRRGKGGAPTCTIRESDEKMSVDEIAGRLQTCAFNETSVPKLGTDCTGGISVMRAGKVTDTENGNRHKVRGRMNGGKVMGTQIVSF